MNPIEESEKLVEKAQEVFSSIPLGMAYLSRLTDLKVRLHQPCELAIAGKVKAGKSSFLNVLIGEDLAKVGDLETTATINRFCYGKPEYPERPGKVVWENGDMTYESLEFMNGLQGHDKETMEKASRIDYLEYRVEHPLLRELTLVDTPGTGAVVDTHEEVAEAYFKLREKHKAQTIACSSRADAVVYLMGAVANIRDKSFLEDFRKSTEGGIPLNAMGVLSKVDIDQVLLNDRENQSKYLADSLKEQLCTVVPISAGLYKAIKEKSELFSKWQLQLKSIPTEVFEKMFKSEKMFLIPSYSSIPIKERKEMKEGLPWSVFRTIARALHESDNPEEAKETLLEVANIEEVRKTINNYFFNRSRTIRCSRIMTELYGMCSELQTWGMFKLREGMERFTKWERFARRHSSEDEASGLADFLKSKCLTKEDIQEIDKSISNLKMGIENVQEEIRQLDNDFQALNYLTSHLDLFSEEEQDELRHLFGWYGQRIWTIGEVEDRLDFWRGEVEFIGSAMKRKVIEYAITKYSQLLR